MIKEINFSRKAVEKINQLIAKKPPGTFFRIAVKGGGCSGFTYDWQPVTSIELETSSKSDSIDHVLDLDTGKLILDGTSIMYLVGMEVDYKKDLFGQRLMVENPNVKSMCGCGESFHVELH